MNKKIKQYSVLTIAAAATIPLSCKKDDNTSTTNVSIIESKTLNKVISTSVSGDDFDVLDSIDVNSDGVYDFLVAIGGENYYGEVYANALLKSNYISGNDFLTNLQENAGESYYMLTTKNSGDVISSASTKWYDYGYAGVKYNSEQLGNANGTDKYYGFRFKIGSATHYGWMKANLAANFKSFTIKELAYHKTANTQIKVGEK